MGEGRGLLVVVHEAAAAELAPGEGVLCPVDSRVCCARSIFSGEVGWGFALAITGLGRGWVERVLRTLPPPNSFCWKPPLNSPNPESIVAKKALGLDTEDGWWE